MSFLNNIDKTNNLNNSLSYLSIFNLPQIIKLYWYTTIEIIFNIFNILNIHRSQTIISNFNFKFIFNYYVSSVYISILILLPVLYSATGDLGKITYLLRVFIGFIAISFLYSCILFITHRIFLFKGILLTLILLHSFIYPFVYLLSIPIFWNMSEFNVDFILGGNSKYEIKFVSENIYFYYYAIILPNIIFLLTTIINIIWFKKILHIKVWESIICFLIVNFYLLPNLLIQINPTVLYIIKKLDKVFNIIGI